VQAVAPRLVARSEVPGARTWSVLLLTIPVLVALALQFAPARPDLIIATGLGLFGLIFAVNSSLHSYLILAYAGSEKAAEDVGFYYAANASGRLIVTLLSGLLYPLGGMMGCLVGSAAMLAACWIITLWLPTLGNGRPAGVGTAYA
jgi:MFS transporter, APGE family, 1-arseno-3-phosphoglycerate exporter